jgi:uncharacterized protein with HEPN domain
MSKRDDLLLIEDMIEAADKILVYSEDMSMAEFFTDEKTKDAVIRNFEVIGEAATRISPEFRGLSKDIPWNQLRGYRNRLIHEYFGVDFEIVFEIIKNDLPNLINDLKILLADKRGG